MQIDQIPASVLAKMILDGCYAHNTDLTEDGHGRTAKYVLVLAVPYGQEDGADTLPDAMEAFHELVGAEDWKERNIMVLRLHNGKPTVYETTCESEEL